MFDVSWTEIMVIGVVALLVVGPKELPSLLRTIGRYVGNIKRQAAEFRAQFDEAMRESELEQLRREVENAGRDMESTVRDAGRSVELEIDNAKREFEQPALAALPEPDVQDTSGAPPAGEMASAGNGAASQGVNGADATSSPSAGAAQIKTGA
jgi:sec-independent protein translocase protein TatB